MIPNFLTYVDSHGGRLFNSQKILLAWYVHFFVEFVTPPMQRWSLFLHP